jgi:hypothetical protein
MGSRSRLNLIPLPLWSRTISPAPLLIRNIFWRNGCAEHEYFPDVAPGGSGMFGYQMLLCWRNGGKGHGW